MTAEEAAADPTVEILSIDPEDAAFILGKGGSTKKKVARAAGVKLELDSSAMDAAAANNANGGDAGANSAPSPSHALYIKDKSEAKRRRAREYVGFVLQQRRGKIEVDFPSDGKPRDDLSIVEVPDDGCKAYITGKNGSVLRMMEEEWGTLMFFGRARDAKGELGEDALMVLGDEEGAQGRGVEGDERRRAQGAGDLRRRGDEDAAGEAVAARGRRERWVSVRRVSVREGRDLVRARRSGARRSGPEFVGRVSLPPRSLAPLRSVAFFFSKRPPSRSAALNKCRGVRSLKLSCGEH